jgi:hypothetical protein
MLFVTTMSCPVGEPCPPVSRVPAELLAYIFTQLHDEEGQWQPYYHLGLQLSGVSQQFRIVALMTSIFWNQPVIKDEKTLLLTELFIAWSRNRQLRFTIHLRDTNLVGRGSQLWNTAVKQSYHCRRFTCTPRIYVVSVHSCMHARLCLRLCCNGSASLFKAHPQLH